ncbi:MAG: hypothetical protein LAT61_00245 [Alcanivorax sp.]|nr:hypothetical protein [Alcanivorax sp.]
MKIFLWACLLLSFPGLSGAESDCSDRSRFAHSEYSLICDAQQQEIFDLKDRIIKDIEFFKAWRADGGGDSSSAMKEDVMAVEGLVASAEEAIRSLARVKCRFAEGGAGFVPWSGSGVLNEPLCRQKLETEETIQVLESAILYLNIEKPSFDCNKATTEIEISICRSEVLSGLDRLISEKFIERYEGGNKKVIEAQRAWLSGSRDGCLGSNDLEGCLKDVMTNRLSDLHGEI